MSYYKVLNAERRSCHGGSQVWTPGEWVWVEGSVVPCKNGIHFCDESNLVIWLGETIWEFEPAGETVWVPGRVHDRRSKLVAQGGRITRQIKAWNKRTQRLFACDCAEHVVHLCDDDPNPSETIVVARRFARGEATREELNAAWDAAWAAADAVVAAGSAYAARAAAGAALDAWDAAWDATWDAARAAEDATWDAARAAEDAWDAERAWQSARLMQYLRGEVA